jgi:hypothetical protein
MSINWKVIVALTPLLIVLLGVAGVVAVVATPFAFLYYVLVLFKGRPKAAKVEQPRGLVSSKAKLDWENKLVELSNYFQK